MISDLIGDKNPLDKQKTPLKGRYIYYVSNSEDEIVYIGQTCSAHYRIDHHKGTSDYDYIRMIEVCDHIGICDAEFMAIVRHKPKYNRQFPVPNYLTTGTKILKDGLDNTYNMDHPDLTLSIQGKTRYFWVLNELKRNSDIMHVVSEVRKIENYHNKQNKMIVDKINELEVKQ